MDLKKYIKDVPDFPKKGILYRDIQPLLANSDAFNHACMEMSYFAPFPDYWVGIESRGFLFAAGIAAMRQGGLKLIRKPGKLPGDLIEKSYSLEYGQSKLSIQKSKNIANKKVIIIDDLIATGGSLACAESLINKAKAKVIGCFVLIELLELNGSNLIDSNIFSIKKY